MKLNPWSFRFLGKDSQIGSLIHSRHWIAVKDTIKLLPKTRNNAIEAFIWFQTNFRLKRFFIYSKSLFYSKFYKIVRLRIKCSQFGGSKYMKCTRSCIRPRTFNSTVFQNFIPRMFSSAIITTKTYCISFLLALAILTTEWNIKNRKLQIVFCI